MSCVLFCVQNIDWTSLTSEMLMWLDLVVVLPCWWCFYQTYNEGISNEFPPVWLQWWQQLRLRTWSMQGWTGWEWEWAAAPSASHRKVSNKTMASKPPPANHPLVFSLYCGYWIRQRGRNETCSVVDILDHLGLSSRKNMTIYLLNNGPKMIIQLNNLWF